MVDPPKCSRPWGVWFAGLALWGWSGSVAAAPSVSLPAAESPAAWAEALRLSGLTGAGAPSVWLVDEGSSWRVRAVGPDGAVREARVAAPTTAAAREEVLALAAALLRSLGSPDAPRALTPPPPPPPPPVASPRPAPRPAPPPVPPPAPPRAPRPRVPFASELGSRRWVEEPPPPPAPPPAPPSEPAPWRPPWLAASASWESRVGLRPALSLAVELRPHRWVAVAVRGGPAAGLRGNDDFFRRVDHLAVDLLVGPTGRVLRPRGLVGAQRHGFRQQGTPFDSVTLGRAGAELGLWTGRAAGGVGVVGQAVVDMGRVELIAAEGSSLPVYSPFSWTIGISGDVGRRGDPRQAPVTSPRATNRKVDR